jgi:hypothetical protein
MKTLVMQLFTVHRYFVPLGPKIFIKRHAQKISNVFPKIVLLCFLGSVEKCGRARQGADDNMKRRMLFACLITESVDTHSEYVILIAFPLQQWLDERAAMLRCTYIGCRV